MLKNGIYDKSIIDCAFREDLRKKKFPDDNSIPPGIKRTKGKMLESDLQEAR